MQSAIEQKMNPSIGKQRPTKRRKQIAQWMIQQEIELETIQSWLRIIAQMWQTGNIPDVLRGISQKTQVETLFKISERGATIEIVQEILENEYWKKAKISLARAGLHTAREIVSAIEEIQKIQQPQPINTVKQQLNQLELEIIGLKSGDFFPTPELICRRLIKLADIQPDWRILEPSAGSGSITQFLIEMYPNIQLEVVEIHHILRQILELKKFNLVGQDFLEFRPTYFYNACIMNPPFCDLVSHIYHAWKLLQSNGVLVSIVPESVFFNRKYKAFQTWLETNNTYTEIVDKNAFLASNNPTSVATRIIKIIKP